ncbi:tail tubular protein B [Pantoea phage vB_PagP-SK1]|uniref:Tail tubular protein B n=1 Tax=Pantoea phage vB_PagP-SK1 TaxID=2653646 RepID=A0A5P8NK80_9CAUD|nr:tail tubular protein B [Pantoea phage vB_PagP-SK1]
MGLVSQSIKNLKGGISQQPNILRFPDQGELQVNGWSSETEGLQKRPPMVFNRKLGPAGFLGAAPLVHLINRDEFEQYYVVFTGGDIKVFDLNGQEYAVRGDKSYVQTGNPRNSIRCVTVADYTFVVNRERVVQADGNLTNGGTFNDQKDALINVRGGQYGRTLNVIFNEAVRATIKLPSGTGTTPPIEEQVAAVDAQNIAEELAKQIRASLAGNPGWNVGVGTGFVHIVAPDGDSIRGLQTKDGYADQLISPVTHYAQTFAKLPQNAPDGYTVKIVGDTSRSADKYYVRYNLTRKVWEETVGWNIQVGLNNGTMPWSLIRAADGQFDFVPNSWVGRTAGDDDTNPHPSFVGQAITDVFFYRNRLGMLSGENIILSRTAKYFNMYPASVAVLSDDDPIDVAVSHNRVSILKYAVPFSEELLLWADEAQFVLNASGVLSAKSVELNLTTEFDVNDGARPYGIGRGVYFASPRATFTSINRYYAVQDVSAVKNAEDMTMHVPSYIPNGVFSISGSSTENFATVLTSGATGKVFIYKFLYIDEQIQQQSWSHWDFGDNVTILAANSIGSHMHVILQNGYDIFMGSISFTKKTLDFGNEPYRLYMDAKTRYDIPANAFNNDRYETTVDLNAVFGGMRWQVGKILVSDEVGEVRQYEPPAGGWASDPTLRIVGDMAGKRVFIGFAYEFRYEFSKFLIKKQDESGGFSTEDVGRLQHRRAWLNYEQSGAFYVDVTNLGRSYRYTMSGKPLGDTTLGQANLESGQFRFPLAGNAQYNRVVLTSDYTTPLSIIGCGWEGNYIRRSTGI